MEDNSSEEVDNDNFEMDESETQASFNILHHIIMTPKTKKTNFPKFLQFIRIKLKEKILENRNTNQSFKIRAVVGVLYDKPTLEKNPTQSPIFQHEISQSSTILKLMK